MTVRAVSDPGTSRSQRNWPWWRLGLTGLSAVALCLSAYLGWHFLVGGIVIGCNAGSPCDQVLNSRWSSVGGLIPVSGLAMGAYLAILLASLFIGRNTDAPVRRLAWRAMLVLSGAIVASAGWFIVVQKWFIGSFCPYCMATHISGLMLSALVLWHAPKQADVMGARKAFGFACVGVALAGIMVVCQIHFVPAAAYRSGNSNDTLPRMDPHAVPIVGSPEAPYVVTLLFDYKCPHCQRLHFLLDEAVRRYDGKLAFVLCPTPLSRSCNPYVPREVDEFKDSCELAKVALAVWIAKREAFSVFDHWMFSVETGDRWHPRSLDAARAKAVELVGQANFDLALTSPLIDRHLRASIQLFGDTLPGGNAGIPKLVFGSHWVIPEPRDADDLISILHRALSVPEP